MSVKAREMRHRQEAGIFDKHEGVKISIVGIELFLHASGVLYWPQEKTLVVADLHLEKGSAFASKQIFLPPYDTSATLQVLEGLLNVFQPLRVISLGDSFHDEAGPQRLSEVNKGRLKHMMGKTEWIWVAGNHDPALPHSLGGRFVQEWALGGLSYRHEPTLGGEGEIAGHLHPSVKVRGRGRSVRSRCFLADEKRLILPAFGSFTGGLNILDPVFDTLFPNGRFQAYALGRQKLFPVDAASFLPG